MSVTARRVVGSTLLAMVAACGSSSDISLRNADHMSFRIDAGTLTGQYNPAGYDKTLVQRQINAACEDNVLSAYGETAHDNGLMAFTANCAGESIVQSGFAEVEKTPDGNYIFEVIGG